MHERTQLPSSLGLGLTGLLAARYLVRAGARRSRVADTRPTPPLAPRAARRCCRRCRSRPATFTDATFAGADLIAISPGVPVAIDGHRDAVARGAEIVGDIELFARALPPGQRVLAITGTNGKTTVTALTGALCRAAGLSTSSPATSAWRCSTRCPTTRRWPDSSCSSSPASSSRRRARSRPSPRRCSTSPRTISTAMPASTTTRPPRRASSPTAACRC